MNVHLVSGSGSPFDHGQSRGLGNLNLGYNEDPSQIGSPLLAGGRGGSHNLVIGVMLDEWDAATAHVRTNDLPEAASRWQALCHEAGFGHVEERFVAPTNLFRVYGFRV